MCGIVGVLCADDSSAVGPLYEALLALQHRGQDAAGIITEDAGRFCLHKDNGMVRDVFGPAQLTNLRGSIGIGHVRYPTAGSSSCAEAQPFYVNSPYGITLAHNGNLVDLPTLKRDLEREFRHLNTGSDSEVLLNLLAIELFSNLSSPSHEGTRSVILAVNELLRRCSGGYACVSMIIGYGLLAFRDPHGIRPLSYGRRLAEGSTEHEYMVASESGALNALGFELLGDVRAPRRPPPRRSAGPPAAAPARQGASHAQLLRLGRGAAGARAVFFEYVYFARPDSAAHDIDVVIPVPDTARTAALECAHALDIPYREGFMKNRYVGRTFIMPAQGLRKKSVRQKLSPIASEFAGRNVLLVDDSIVRGTTSSQIINMAREAGAKRVYMASAAPPVRYPNVYGIDMPTSAELLASRYSDEQMDEMAREIGADRIFYQAPPPGRPELDDLRASILEEAAAQGSSIRGLDCSCFDGKYVTEHVGAAYLQSLAQERKANRGDSDTNACHLLYKLDPAPAGAERAR
ncbi:hypothetical protein EMIHUDRAFT_421791 [Emiliania huxleyi CCMP1516]|uniref:Amidophosphoribosyltransferase n=2 Tax=Emiliania huxleyi TaxID=2903 RepID=A0A0D3J1T1_EMIH1|nr:hypothetical protein EMIHUDRAFT_421791 [Emiliania huxleyi CCMP1516]EOD17466.1 hypothetical protein EMIHUDRAFT_421791 [Emiliania huxleyi CCMP1516]|eukprot:XP_005769895.1 hypothetical protein EMIHUDRAFT_421791 [Emiliania huxleyi CCMP1516]